MTVHVKEFVQRDFTQAQVDLLHKSGDFSNLSGLMPARDTPGRLRRAPDWSAHLPYAAGLDTVRHIFYDHSANRFVFIGLNASNQLASCYVPISSWTMAGLATLNTGLSGLGGLFGRNVVWFNDDLYVIANNNQLYDCATYSGTLASLDTDSFRCLATYGDRLYAARTDGSIERLDAAGTAMEAHWTANHAEMDIDFITGYRGYLYAIAYNSEGTCLVVQFDTSIASRPYHQVMAELHDTGTALTKGCPYIQYENYIYFIPGIYTTYTVSPPTPDTYAYAPLYRYRFSSAGTLELVATIECGPTDYFTLLNYRGHLLVANLVESASADISFKLVHEGGVSDAIPLTADTSTIQCVAASSHGILVLTGVENGTEGIYHAGSTSRLQDGYLETSRLDMDHPGREKRLDRITVHLDGGETDFDVIIKYRVDDNTAWTTAITADATQRVTIGDLGVSFYTLQIQVHIDDDSGNNADHRINALSVIYTVDD